MPLTRFLPALTSAKVMATLAVASLAVAAPAFGMHPPGGALQARPLDGSCQEPSAPYQCLRPAQDSADHCQRPSALFHCYGPAQIRRAYNIEALIDAGRDGSGQTITIIDAFQNPTMASDLAKFDSRWRLPAPPSFTTIAPFGIPPFNPNDENQVGWAGEIAIDVEWAHAVAPGAKIVLALSPNDSDPAEIKTERYVVQHHLGSVVSMSFGESEQCMASHLRRDQHSLYSTATAQGITFVAALSDVGAANGAPPWPCDPFGGAPLIKAVDIPGSDPNVTGVGGTDLVANLKTGRYKRESVWNEGFGAGGGGFSSLYSRPAYQSSAVRRSMRGVPDVTYSASLAHSFVFAFGSSGRSNEYWVAAGTSFGTPQWAGMVAIADQIAGHGLGNINPTLYSLAHGKARSSLFHDITVGNNNFRPIRGYSARPGWDAASGLGSPIARALVPALAGASPPIITIKTPARGARYRQRQKVNADYSCFDPDGPSDVASCHGPVPAGKPIDTAMTGTHSFTVNASDKAGNASSKIVHYTVLKHHKHHKHNCRHDQDRTRTGDCIQHDDDDHCPGPCRRRPSDGLQVPIWARGGVERMLARLLTQ